MVGVMVDLGWPWWVSTLIASGVAAVTCAVALLSRRSDVRVVAVVLALEAVAIAVIAPFVMQDNASGRSAMHASPSAMDAASLTRAEFARRADANCAALDPVFAAAGNPQTPAAIGRQLDRIMPALWHAIAQQGTLAAPPADQATAARWMNAMTASTADLEALGRAGRDRDAAGVKAANARLAVDNERSAQLSKQLGLKVCFS